MKKYAGDCERCGGAGRVIDPAWLRARRERAGLSLAGLAARMPLILGRRPSRSYLHMMETGQRRAPLVVVRVYEGLGRVK